MTIANNVASDVMAAVRYCSLAYSDNKGHVKNIPLSYAYDNKKLYFRSPGGTNHGRMLPKRPTVSIVIMDTTQQTKGAVYISSFASLIVEEKEKKYAQDLLVSRLGDVRSAWSDVEYFFVPIGEPDQEKTIDRMLYFKQEMSHEG